MHVFARLRNLGGMLTALLLAISLLMGQAASIEAQTSTECQSEGTPCADAKAYFETFSSITMMLALATAALALAWFFMEPKMAVGA